MTNSKLNVKFSQSKVEKSAKIWLVAIILLGALVVRVFDWQRRIPWNVDQSLMFWQIKSVVVDRKITLIGLHFFSLLHGAVYRTAIYNWLMAIPMAIFGLKVKTAMAIFAIISIASIYLLSKVALSLGGRIAHYISLILYAFSWFISHEEMRLWYAALMIPLSSFILWWMFGKSRKITFHNYFILGLLCGFGFSLHFVIVWLIAGIVLYWILVDRSQLKIKISGLVAGLLLMLSPLILFNLRHDFIMNRGLVNMITGEAVEDQATLIQRFVLATSELPCVIGKTSAIGCNKALSLIILFASFAIVFIFSKGKTRYFSVFVLIQVLLAFIGIFYAGRLDYSSQHYVFYLIPMLIVLFSLTLSRVLPSRYWILGGSFLLFFLYLNLTKFISYQDLNSYFYKRELAKFIYSIPSQTRIGIKFWDQEALAFDFVFYEAAADLGVPYEKVNIIERWGSDQPDGFVFVKDSSPGQGRLYSFGGSKLLMVSQTETE
jgi:hypothetical protein